MIKTYESQRVNEVIRTEAFSANRADFLATHTPFRALKFVKKGNQLQQTASEEQFFKQEIMAERGDHQFVIIKGSSGSGKSNLICWLKERYSDEVKPEEEAIIFIERSQNSLRGALEQIIHSNIFPEGFQSEKIKKLSMANQHLDGEDLAMKILHEFAMVADTDTRNQEKTVLDNRYQKKLHDFLLDEVVRSNILHSGGPIERIKNRLSPDQQDIRIEENAEFVGDDFSFCYLEKRRMRESAKNARDMAEDLGNPRGGDELRQKLAKYLNERMDVIIQNCTNLRNSDLKAVFDEIRTELKKQGKKLTLFIEDITSFTGIDRALIDVLVTEHKGGHNEEFCRLVSVVGITDDYYDTQLRDNYKARITCLVMNNEALFTKDIDVLELVGRYINAISLSNKDLEKWIQKGSHEEDLPIYKLPTELQWANYTLEDGRVFPLYPFNAKAVITLYQGMDPRNRNPRRFLQQVLLYLLNEYSAAVDGEGDFPPEELSQIFKIPLFNHLHMDLVQRQSGPTASRMLVLLNTWGEGNAFSKEENGTKFLGGLDASVFKAFNLKMIKGFDTTDPSMVAKKPEDQNQNQKIIAGNSKITPTTPEAGVVSKTPEVNRSQEKIESLRRELDSWLIGNSLSSFKELRQDFRGLLVDCIDWEMKGVSAMLVADCLGSVDNVAIEGQIGDEQKAIFILHRSKEAKRILEGLAYWRQIGEKSWRFEGADVYLSAIYKWINIHEHEVITAVTRPKGNADKENWECGKWSTLADVYRLVLNGCLTENHKDPITLYQELYKNIDIETQSIQLRSNIWQELMTDISLVSNDNHAWFLRYFCLVQGDPTKSGDSFFIDAGRVLQILKGFIDSNWDLNAIDMSTVNGLDWKDRYDKLYRGILLLDRLKNKLPNVLVEEKKRIEKLDSDLASYIGRNPTLSELNQLQEQMRSFLDCLKTLHIGFTQDNFRFLTNEVWKNQTLLIGKQEIARSVQEKNPMLSWLRLSNDPSEKVKDYLIFLKNINDLNESIYQIYSIRVNQSSLIDDVTKLESEIIDSLEKYCSELETCK